MNKGLRLTFVALKIIHFVTVGDIDLMKKGLRLINNDLHVPIEVDPVRNLDLVNKGLRLLFPLLAETVFIGREELRPGEEGIATKQ